MHSDILNKAFRQQSILVYFISALVVVSILIFGILSLARFKDAQITWEANTHRAFVISRAIADLSRHIGYGGFIHNFKNLVIRRDLSRYQPIIEENIVDLNHDLDQLRHVLTTTEELKADKQLRATFSEYISKYLLSVSMIKKGKNTSEIDAIARVDDTAALKAKIFLISSIERHSLVAQQQAEDKQKIALNFLKLGGIIIFIAILFTTAIMIVYLRRILTANRVSLQNKNRLDNLLDTAPDPMISVTSGGYIVRANHMAEKLFGYSNHELLRMNIEALIPERYRKQHKIHQSEFFTNPKNLFWGRETHLLLL